MTLHNNQPFFTLNPWVFHGFPVTFRGHRHGQLHEPSVGAPVLSVGWHRFLPTDEPQNGDLMGFHRGFFNE